MKSKKLIIYIITYNVAPRTGGRGLKLNSARRTAKKPLSPPAQGGVD